MDRLARFNAQIAKTWNAQVWPEQAHLAQQNAYVFPRPARKPKEKPAVKTYRTTLTTLARETPEQAEAKRQQAILATRLANLEKARAVKAANRTAKETAPVSQIDTLKAQIAALTAQIEALASPQVAPAPAPRKAQPAPVAPVAKKAPYVKTALKMVDYGKGRRALQIDNTLVVVAWNGKTWDYACGTRKGTAADRGEAFAKVNVLLANAGLPPVRA